MTRPYSEIINGYHDPNLEFMREGNFTLGEGDPSFQTYVSIDSIYKNETLINEKTTMAIYTGHKHINMVKSIRSINGDVNLNKISTFYSGEETMYGIYNPYGKKIRVNGSDGLQFTPRQEEVNGYMIKKFSERLSRPLEYKFGKKDKVGDVMTWYFTLDPKNTDPNDETAKNLNTIEKGVFSTSSVYNVPV